MDSSSGGRCHQCPEQASATMIKRDKNSNGINQNTTTFQEIALITGLARYDRESDSLAVFVSIQNPLFAGKLQTDLTTFCWIYNSFCSVNFTI